MFGGRASSRAMANTCPASRARSLKGVCAEMIWPCAGAPVAPSWKICAEGPSRSMWNMSSGSAPGAIGASGALMPAEARDDGVAGRENALPLRPGAGGLQQHEAKREQDDRGQKSTLVEARWRCRQHGLAPARYSLPAPGTDRDSLCFQGVRLVLAKAVLLHGDLLPMRASQIRGRACSVRRGRRRFGSNRRRSAFKPRRDAPSQRWHYLPVRGAVLSRNV